MNTDLVKGFKDFIGEEAEKRAYIRKVIAEIFSSYGFEPAETPIVERVEFVEGDDPNDEAVSEIYRLEDRGKRKLALRYESTFQLKRIMKGQKIPYKRYQIGEVFRDEPISENRFRQFTQCDLDVVGSKVIDEAEVFSVVKGVLDKLKIGFTINVNNRKLLNEILKKAGVNENDFADVIRIIDKLDKKSEKEVKEELKSFGAEKVISIFKKDEKDFVKYEAYSEIKELKKFCKMFNVKINFQPSLARGLSYYNGTVFEVKTKGMKETICGGGAYFFNNTQCFGFAFGLDRLAILMKQGDSKEKKLVLSIGEDKEAIRIVTKLREEGESVYLWTGKIGKGMDYANSKGVSEVIFVGAEEVRKGKFKVRDMESGKEKFVKLGNLK
ncbi:histidine--tRNA ligase [Candidatus Pacearchaeota archaeon]|nr:histidine--tRNA ligase [Candidatus Pacearchaeota archaeon]